MTNMLRWLLLISVSIYVSYGFLTSIPGKARYTQERSLKRLNSAKTGADELELETSLLTELSSPKARDDVKISTIVAQLEEKGAKIERNIPPKTQNSALDGCWRLLYTSPEADATNSPIQRTVTGASFREDSLVSVFQVVNVVDSSRSFLGPGNADVSNVVCIGTEARLRVTALASTQFTPATKRIIPRQSDGRIFGLNIFGISSSRAPRDPSERIDFAFQEAGFEFTNLPFSVPYPVPFKLLGDEAKGWIDNTYLSKSLRIARGNKGTTFVLKKVPDPDSDSLAAWAVQNMARQSRRGSDKGRVRATVSRTIIFPAQLGVKGDYTELSEKLESRNPESRCFVAPLRRLGWIAGLLPSLPTADYLKGTLKPAQTLRFYCEAVDAAVEDALRDAQNAQEGKEDVQVSLNLVGHSIGGWIARFWLSEWASPSVRARVRTLVTLGTPHADALDTRLDQTRGLLSYVNREFPGAYQDGVDYVCVVGDRVDLSCDSDPADPGTGRLATSTTRVLERLVAKASYAALGGVKAAAGAGDGVIPVSAGVLPGARTIRVAVSHSNFLPTPLNTSLRLPLPWYGDVVEQVTCSTVQSRAIQYNMHIPSFYYSFVYPDLTDPNSI
jgi:hypothetical protein